MLKVHRALRSRKNRILFRLRHNAWLAALWRRLMWRTTVIAVTGSVGKTTCRELLYQILADQAPTYRTRNNENDAHGLPGVVLGLRPWHRYAVIEVAASGPGTLGPLARMVRPDIAIVTAVARTHTRNYADVDAIAYEKSELLRQLKPRGTAVLNGDDPRVTTMHTLTSQSRVEFGRDPDCAVSAQDVSAVWPQRLQLTVKTGQGLQLVQTQLVGEHWTNSVLAAIAAAQQCGVKLADIAGSVARVRPFRGRMEPIRLANGATAISDQNASQDVFEAMLAVAVSAQAPRKVLVLGDLIDTDAKSTKARRRLAGRLVAPIFDFAIFYGQSAHRAQKAAVDAGMPPDSVLCAETLAEADVMLKAELRASDLLFVKGRNLQHLQRLIFMQVGPIECSKETCRIRSDCEICGELQPKFDLTTALAPPVA